MKANKNFFAYPRLCKSISLCLFLFQFTFLNIIVPGHTRGIITLTGKTTITSAADLACPFCQSKNPDSKKPPSDQDRRQCAICSLAVRLTLPPVVNFDLAKLCLLEIAPPPTKETAPFCIPLPTHYSRGPPLSFS